MRRRENGANHYSIQTKKVMVEKQEFIVECMNG
jgi:hypothetical protein